MRWTTVTNEQAIEALDRCGLAADVLNMPRPGFEIILGDGLFLENRAGQLELRDHRPSSAARDATFEGMDLDWRAAIRPAWLR